jgi:hypothetical protein
MPLGPSYYPGIGEHDCSRNVRHSRNGGWSPTQMKMAERRRILANTQCAVARGVPAVVAGPVPTALVGPSAFFPCAFNKPQTNPIATRYQSCRPCPASQPCSTKRTQSAAAVGCPASFLGAVCVLPLCFQQTPNEPKRTRTAAGLCRRCSFVATGRRRRIPASLVGASAFFPCVFNKPQTNPIAPLPEPGVATSSVSSPSDPRNDYDRIFIKPW